MSTERRSATARVHPTRDGRTGVLSRYERDPVSVTKTPVEQLAPIWIAELDQPDAVWQALIDRILALSRDPQTRKTHWFEQRFENIYIDREKLPELQPIATAVLDCACQVLGRDDVKFGFWFNEMAPGHRTTRHDHFEDDELLSAVLYLTAPEASGDLLLFDDPMVIRVPPAVGRLVLFPPDLPHEVETNHSDETRLSVAFNFGRSASEAH